MSDLNRTSELPPVAPPAPAPAAEDPIRVRLNSGALGPGQPTNMTEQEALDAAKGDALPEVDEFLKTVQGGTKPPQAGSGGEGGSGEETPSQPAA